MATGMAERHVAHILFFVFHCLLLACAEEGRHTRFEYKQSFKGPHLVNKQGNIPFWTYYGSAIPSDEQVRVTPSLKDQRGGLWAKTKTNAPFWEIEVFFKVSGRGRVGGDGLAVWFTKDQGTTGPVFGSSDHWTGMGLFFDSFDNDGEQNNPYVMVMLNDGTKTYDHFKDGSNQQLGGCMRDFRNRPHAIRAKVRYYNNVLTVFYHNGMSEKSEDYELCMRAENVELPKEGFFGVTAATGGLADDHDVIKFLTHSLTPPLSEEEKKKMISEDQRKKYEEQYGEFTHKLEEKKTEFQKEHPEKQVQEEKFESVYERDIRLIYEGQNSMHQIMRGLHSKTGELTTEINNLHSAVNQKTSGGGGSSDGPSRNDVNRLINLQNEVHTAIRDLQSRSGNTDDQRKLERVEQNIRTILENVVLLASKMNDKTNKQASQQNCPTVTCLSTGTFIFMMFLQIALIVGYSMYQNYQQQQAKKFY
ncbi:protein ERGIC-53-like [Clytia hemisphaerica]|uniref:L-type lectin-like domain-containing protein n=1 Tax=Clytia hemisphaerica TaxID=252671 RepID=A0A7M5X1Q3_9CNID